MICTLASLLRCRRGATAVEFALVSIPLLFFLLGIMELGRALQYRTTLQHAVGVAARYGSTYTGKPNDPRPSADAIRAKALEAAGTIEVPAEAFTVVIDDAVEMEVTVTANYEYQFLFVSFLPWSSVTLTAEAIAVRYVE